MLFRSTDVVPANRGVQDMRAQAAPAAEVPGETDESERAEASQTDAQEETRSRDEYRNPTEPPEPQISSSAEPGQENSSGDRDRGNWRGRRRRRGGRRDGRDSGRDRGAERGADRGGERAPEPRFSRPAEPRTPSGPPAGYQPILLPGESISKYQRWSQQAPVATHPAPDSADVVAETADAPAAPLAATFPEDEPIFAAGETLSEPLHEEHDDTHEDEVVESASTSTSTSWNPEIGRAHV